MLWRKSVEMDKNSDYYENCEKVSIRFVGHGHPFHNSAMRGLKGSTVKKKRDSQSKMNRIERIEGGGEVRRVKRPMEIRTVFVAPLTIFTCDSYGMIVSIVCSRDIGDFEDRWKTKPGRGKKAKGKKDQSFERSLCLDYTDYTDLHVVCKDHF